MTIKIHEMRGKRPRDEALAKEFSIRLKQIFGDLSHPKVSEKLDNIVSSVTLWDYVNGHSMPRPEVLIKIAEKFDVSLDWLLRGIETPKAEKPSAYNPEVLRDIIEAVEEFLEEEGKELPGDKKAELVTMLYEETMEEEAEEVVKGRIQRLMRMALRMAT